MTTTRTINRAAAGASGPGRLRIGRAAQQVNSIPSNALTLGGEPLTLDGEFLTLGA